MTGGDRIAPLVKRALETVPGDVVLVPTRGLTANRVMFVAEPSPRHEPQPG